MFNFFIDRPVLSTVIALLITLTGVVAVIELPIAQYPQIVPPQVQVTTSFPGANAQVVSESIAAPIEQQVNGAQGMIYMSSKSDNAGAYTLTVTFDVGINQNDAAVDVQNRVGIAQSQLPPDVIRQGITIRKVSTDFLEVLALTSPDRRYDNVFISNYALLNVQDALARVRGVGQIRLFGARDYSMRIWLDPDRMARLGVTVNDVQRAVAEQNVVAPAGQLGVPPAPQGQQMQYSVLVQGRLADPEQYRNIVLRGTTGGQLVRLRDVARVELEAADYAISAREDGRPAIFIGIFLQPDANALDVARQVKQTMDDLARQFPPGLVYSIPYSTTPFVTESLKEVVKTLGEAFLLVVLVVYLFLQSWRATLIPILVVPVSLVGTFAAFSALGFSINTLTLFGLVLSIGIVVDDAIVVVEAVEERMESHHLGPREATKMAMSEVGGPVIAIALVLAAVFVPVAFQGGLTGQLYKQFALTLAFSVMLSAICALTFTPAMCALLLRPVDRHRKRRGPLGPFFRVFNRGFEGFRTGYLGSVQYLIRHLLLVMLTFGVMLLAVWGLISNRPTGLVPDEDQGYLLSVMQLPPAASVERTQAAVEQFEGIVRGTKGVDGIATIMGFNFITGVSASYAATSFIRFKPWDERHTPDQTGVAIRNQLMGRGNSQIKDAQMIVLSPPPIRGLGAAGGFTFVLQDRSGGDAQRFGRVLADFLAEARKRPELGFVFTAYDSNVPQIEYQVNRDMVKSLGVQLSDVFFALQTFLGGFYINDFNLFGRTFRVVAQAESTQRAQPDDVKRFYVRNADGGMVPLGTLLTAKPINGPQYFERFNIYRAATINGAAAPGYSSGQVIDTMEKLARALPDGFGFEWSDATYQEKKTAGQTGRIFVLSLAFVFLVLAALYESWTMPVAILLVIPFGVLGAFLGLFLRGYDNNVYTQIGLIMLIGLAAKNAILIVEFAKIARERGRTILQSALDGSRLRLRPILMTSFAFIFGSLPLAVAFSAGAGARQAIGTAVVFGMLIATLVGIFFIPAFYVLLQRVSERQSPFRGEEPAQEPATGPRP